MSWFITHLLSAMLMPPFNLLIPGTAGLLLLRSRPRLGRILLSASLLLLWLLSCSFFAEYAQYWLGSGLRPVDPRTTPADAIVVLGGGNRPEAPEYGGMDTIGYSTLERLRYAARLQRETGKPVLVSGGQLPGLSTTEAQQMKAVMEQEFNTPVRWTEGDSLNTLENARYSSRLLQREGIKRIYLVTHAIHMPRAVMAFESAGLEVVPAATCFNSAPTPDLSGFLPSAGGLYNSSIFMHEVIGMLWYRLKS